LLDRFDSSKYKNPNMFVVGTSGSGKSYFIKLMINRNRFLNITQFIIDPDREYSKLCEKLNGSLINFGNGQSINVFDIRQTSLDEGESYLKNKVAKLNVFFSVIFKEITDEEKALVEEKIILCYKEKGISEDNDSLIDNKAKCSLLGNKSFKQSSDMPTIKELYNYLSKDKKLKKFANMLKPYISGSMSYLSTATNINLDNKLVVVDIHEISEEQMPIVMFIVMDYFWDVIKKDRSQKRTKVNRER
jgi:type IV secretory pathway VirB4 component